MHVVIHSLPDGRVCCRGLQRVRTFGIKTRREEKKSKNDTKHHCPDSEVFPIAEVIDFAIGIGIMPRRDMRSRTGACGFLLAKRP